MRCWPTQWPGNVRELENALERAVILTPRRRRSTPTALPERVTRARARAARRRARAGEPDARGDRARVHHVGAAERGRQQEPRRRSARHRSVDAVPQAVAVRRRGVTVAVPVDDGICRARRRATSRRAARRPGGRSRSRRVGALALAVGSPSSTRCPSAWSPTTRCTSSSRESLATGQGYRFLNLPGAPGGDALPAGLSRAARARCRSSCRLSRRTSSLFKAVNAVFLAVAAVCVALLLALARRLGRGVGDRRRRRRPR